MQIARSYYICPNLCIAQSCSRKYYYSFANMRVSKIACVDYRLFVISHSPSKDDVFIINFVKTQEFSFINTLRDSLEVFLVNVGLSKISR